MLNKTYEKIHTNAGAQISFILLSVKGSWKSQKEDNFDFDSHFLKSNSAQRQHIYNISDHLY